METGRKGTLEVLVQEGNVASAVGSGLLPVFATPQLVALMEGAACKALEGTLPEGSTTVGARIDVQHTAATPIGMHVRAEATITAVEGRKITFRIEAFDEAGSVGMAAHDRFVVDSARFMQKAEAKKG